MKKVECGRIQQAHFAHSSVSLHPMNPKLRLSAFILSPSSLSLTAVLADEAQPANRERLLKNWVSSFRKALELTKITGSCCIDRGEESR